MLPEIGLMIGAYIITRMLVVAIPPTKTGAVGQVIATIAAVITILVAAGVMLDLFTRGTTTPGLTP